MLNRARKAFTMLELIVVIVILGILAAIAIPTFQTVIEKSRISSLKQTASSVDRNALALAGFENDAADVENYRTAAGEVKDTKLAVTYVAGAASDNAATAGVDESKDVYEFTKGGLTVRLTASGAQGVSGVVADDKVTATTGAVVIKAATAS